MFYKIRQQTRRPRLKALRMARTDAGLTISELAKRAGVSRDTISNAERGQHSLQAPTLHKLARTLGKTPSELLAEEERLAPKVASRSSLEQSFDDVLKEERRKEQWKDIYGVVRDAAKRQAKQDAQAAARAMESGRAQTYFMRHENEAVHQLTEYPADELASVLMEVMYRQVLLEEALQQAEASSEEGAEHSRSGSA